LRREKRRRKKIGIWQRDKVNFAGSREWNGLRALMALINNWDLKDANNSVYKDGSLRIYMVSDLGASFGSANKTWPINRAKGNLSSYSHSKFISRLGSDTVDFQVPGRPSFACLVNPKAYFMRVHLEHLGRNVPRADAGSANFWRACLRPRSEMHSVPPVIPPRRFRLLPAIWRTASVCSQASDRRVFAERTSRPLGPLARKVG
jgi:hypothetical protein